MAVSSHILPEDNWFIGCLTSLCFNSKMSAFREDPAKMPPSTKSFFEDPIKPASFASMDSWTDIRDVLYFVGKPFSHQVQVDKKHKLTFLDKRAIVYRMATTMNIMQEDYGRRANFVAKSHFLL